MKPLLWAVLGVATLGVAVVVVRRRAAAAPSSAAASACEVACVAAARAAGVTGDLSKLCKGSCGLLGGLKDYGQKAVNSVGGALNDVFGGDRGPGFCSSCCPEGSRAEFSRRPWGESTVSLGVMDHRGEADGADNVWGAVCVDEASGEIIGTLTDKFNPIRFGDITPTKPSSLVMNSAGLVKLGAIAVVPTGTAGVATGANGGVVVTSGSGMTREQESTAEAAAAHNAMVEARNKNPFGVW